jgi:CRP-like cAMP-binding protein
MNFSSYIGSLIPVSEKLKDRLNRIGTPIAIRKGELLLTPNERSKYLHFIESGLLRGYYEQDGKEITSWFASEGEFATCFYSFITKEASNEYIQAIEPAQLIRIADEDLQKLYSDFPETERIGRLLTEQYYIKLEGRLLSIQFKTAKERYDNLLTTNPGLLRRAPLGQIASWLGITQETLSRIRSEA